MTQTSTAMESSSPVGHDPLGTTAVEVRIPSGNTCLSGDLTQPHDFKGLVLFVDGTGSGRHCAQYRRLAQTLHRAGLATLLFDLLTAREEQIDLYTHEHRFDMGLLTSRLQDATLWALTQARFSRTRVGYFGAKTGAAAALIAAARLGPAVGAVVSCGGRLDLTGPVTLGELAAPTLLISGGTDLSGIQQNENAFARMKCVKRLDIVQGASSLFESRGSQEQVAALAAEWFAPRLAGVVGLRRTGTVTDLSMGTADLELPPGIPFSL